MGIQHAIETIQLLFIKYVQTKIFVYLSMQMSQLVNYLYKNQSYLQSATAYKRHTTDIETMQLFMRLYRSESD